MKTLIASHSITKLSAPAACGEMVSLAQSVWQFWFYIMSMTRLRS